MKKKKRFKVSNLDELRNLRSRMDPNITQIGSYFYFYGDFVNVAMLHMTAKNHRRIARVFMEIVEEDLYTVHDEDDSLTLDVDVDEDIHDLVYFLVSLYTLDILSMQAMEVLIKKFRKYNDKNKNNNGKEV